MKGVSFENSVLWVGDGQQLVASWLGRHGVTNILVSIKVAPGSGVGWFGGHLVAVTCTVGGAASDNFEF